MKFDYLYLLHGKGGSPNGSVKQLKHALVPLLVEGLIFIRPDLPHGDIASPAEYSVRRLRHLDLSPNSLVIGISLGGLVAAALQEDSRPDLTVICLSSPTWADGIQLEEKPDRRIALYSSHDPVLQGRTGNWPLLAEAYDKPWLDHDTDKHIPRLAGAIAEFVNHRNSGQTFENC